MHTHYGTRSEEGRALASIKNCVEPVILVFKEYANNTQTKAKRD